MKNKLIALAITALFAGHALALGVDTEQKGTSESRKEQSRDQSNKATNTIGVVALLADGLRGVMPASESYVRRILYAGHKFDRITADRVGYSYEMYAAKRIAELQVNDPVSIMTRAVWTACQAAITAGNEACAARLAAAETYAMAVQVAMMPASPNFGYVKLNDNGSTRIVNAEFGTWVGQLAWHADFANAVATHIARQVPTATPMSLGERRFTLVRAFLDAPLDDLRAAANHINRADTTATTNVEGPGKPISLIVNGGNEYKFDGSGVTVSNQGGPWFNASTVSGYKLEYADEASAAQKQSTSKSKSSSTTTKKTTIK